MNRRYPAGVLLLLVIVALVLWGQSASTEPTEPTATPPTTTTSTSAPKVVVPSTTPAQTTTSAVDGMSSTVNGPPSTVDGPPSTVSDTPYVGCDPVQKGWGVTLVSWGRVQLPYAAGWPTNEPGELVDCTPQSDMGGAVAAVHALYVEAFTPSLIPELAADTPGRQVRIDSHSGPADPANLDTDCWPLGWAKPGSRWLIYHQCGDHPPVVTEVDGRWVDGRWLLVYTIDGRPGVTREAENGETYHPFGGGDERGDDDHDHSR